MSNLNHTAAEIRDRVMQVLLEVAPDIDPRAIDAHRPLRDQVDFDSMDTLHLALGLKAALGIEVPERDYRELESIDRCTAYLEARQTPCGPMQGR